MPAWVTESIPLVALVLAAGVVAISLWIVHQNHNRAFRMSVDSMRLAHAANAETMRHAKELVRVHESALATMAMLKGLHPHHADPKTFTPSTVARKDAEIVETAIATQEAEAEARELREFARQRTEWEAAERADAESADAAAALAYRNAVDATAKPK